MDHPIINTISLCAGVGMLDEAFRLGCEHLGLRARTAMCAEWEGYAAACLLARMEEASMEPAPIWCGDLRQLDCRAFRGRVGAVIAGLPCQPYSCAGKGTGNKDERSHGENNDGPIPQFLRIVAECQPALVFCENVPPWVRGGWFRPVGEELCRLGYTLAEPLFVTAESVGASHRRERVFVLGYSSRSTRQWNTRSLSRTEAAGRLERLINGDLSQRPEFTNATLDDSASPRSTHPSERGIEGEADGQSGMSRSGERCNNPLGQSSGGRRRIDQPGRGSDRRTAAGRAGAAVVHAEGERTHNVISSGTGEGLQHTDGRNSSLADSERSRSQGDGPAEPERWDIAVPRGADRGIFAPGPGADWANIPEHLWPAVEPGFRLLVDGAPVVLDAGRTDQLRCGGNGCVPLAASVAFVELMRRAGLV